MCPTTRVYTVWLRFLHETACIDQAWNFSTGKTDSAIQSVFQTYRPDGASISFSPVFPRRKSGKTDCSRNGNLPDIGFCDLSIGKTDCLRNGVSVLELFCPPVRHFFFARKDCPRSENKIVSLLWLVRGHYLLLRVESCTQPGRNEGRHRSVLAA